ncbi:MAG: histidine kinase dimerization/phosphoacceptor domain -containing protein [Pirellulales bacterium]
MSARRTELFRHNWQNRLLAYLVSTVAVVVAVLVEHWIPPLESTPIVLFFAAVTLAAWFGGKGPAVLAIVLSSVIVDFFLVTPRFSVLASVADVVRLAVFVGVALSICYLQENYRRASVLLHDANDELESRVAERTADLADANRSLRHEIEEREQAELALRESEKHLRLALGEVESSLNDKEVLLRELHHRVKNNLQVITSLLSLQASRAQNPAVKNMFTECRQRVRAIALVHQRLSSSARLANIDLAAYFHQLVGELHRSYYIGGGDIRPTVVAEPMTMSIDQLVPCALIVNELACNCFKYAFGDRAAGEVRIEIHRHDDRIHLTVADDGVGIDPDALQRNNGVGLQIVHSLVDQLSGELTWENGRGTSATIEFPESK